MQSISVDTETMDWMPGTPFYGPGAIFEGREVVHLKVLSDRRDEGGGIAWLVRFTPPQGKAVTGGEVLNKASDVGMDELQAKLAPALDPVLQFAFKDLASKLDGIRSTAAAQKAVTMEVYLGRLPYLRALLFRNTFFPVWDLLVQQVFGQAGGPISGFLNSSSAFLKGAKGGVDDVRDKMSRAKNVADTVGRDGLSAGSGGSNLGEIQKAWNEGGIQQSQDPAVQQMQSDFPIQGRQNTATGKAILQDEWNGVTVIAPPQYTNYPPEDTGAAGASSQAAPQPAASPLPQAPAIPGF